MRGAKQRLGLERVAGSRLTAASSNKFSCDAARHPLSMPQAPCVAWHGMLRQQEPSAPSFRLCQGVSGAQLRRAQAATAPHQPPLSGVIPCAQRARLHAPQAAEAAAVAQQQPPLLAVFCAAGAPRRTLPLPPPPACCAALGEPLSCAVSCSRSMTSLAMLWNT